MAKRMFAAALAAVMTVSMLAGCGSSGDSGSSGNTDANDGNTTGTASDSADGETSDGEVDHIIMTYLTIGMTPTDLGMVQDAVNEISREKIGVEVELKDIPISDTFSNYSLWIGSGEQIDLMMIAFQGINNYVNSGQLLALDDMLDSDAAYLKGLSEEFPLTDGAVIDGATYGIRPVSPTNGFRGGLVMREDYFDETGETLKDEYTWDEVTDILVKIKENHPDSYPYCVLGSGVGSAMTNYNFFAEMDSCGTTAASGALLSADSTTIENVFATEEYKNYVLLMRDWYEKGLIMPDAATTDSITSELMSSDKCSAYSMNVQPAQTVGTESSYGWTSVALNVTDGYYPSVSGTSSTYWTVPITSAHPDAAMKFLNLMYEDQDVANLLKAGIEGVHYVKTDKDYVIAYPDGVDGQTSTYTQPLGLYGDRRYELSYSEGASFEENEAWSENNKKKTYKDFGYNYDTSAMTNQLIAVNTVLDQYLPSLENGSVENVEEVYEQFIAALETAGINEIIADNQAQLDAWLAQQN